MIIIPIAGESSRFKKIGIKQPKWSIRLGDKFMLELSIESILDTRQHHEKILLICLQKDFELLKNIITQIRIDLEFFEIHSLKKSTNGQAQTVVFGLNLSKYNPNERLLIWCGDSYIRSLNADIKYKKENHLVLSDLQGDHWSFAKVSGSKVIETIEKKELVDLLQQDYTYLIR